MFRFSSRRLAAVMASDIIDAAKQLNKLLDLTQRDRPANRDDIKKFLHNSVSPVLASTELDRRGNSRELRQFVSQLTRDAAFASLIVNARPNSPFVTSIATCIKEDQRRMRFVPTMSSPQASKLIDYLCRIGVRDEEVFPVLISRLNFASLHELSRAMFALSEARLPTMNMLVLLPLYCGEKWTLEFAATKGLSEKSRRHTCNVFEAVRVLRAMSKSCRATMEAARRDPTRAAIPSESVHLMRNRLLEFIFANAVVLRGAHWLNIARALLHFPSEFSELRGFSAVYPAIEAEVRAGSPQTASSTSPAASCVVNCDTVAAVAIARVFQYAEKRAPLPTADGTHSVTPEFPFDLSLMDVVKLLPLLDQFPHAVAHAATQERVETVLRVMTAHVRQLQLRDLVTALQVLRRTRLTATTQAAVEAIATEAGRRLATPASVDTLSDVSFRTVAQLAAALAALRVERCDGFVAYLSANTASFPAAVTAETALSIVNALAAMSTSMPRTAASHPALRELLNGVLQFHRRHLEEGPLLELHPVEVARMLRGCVLLDYVPTAAVLNSLLGCAAKPLRINAAVREAGGGLVFDLSRTLAHFTKHVRSSGTAELEQDLWDSGVRHCVLPLAVACTEAMTGDLERYRATPSSSRTAVAWRTTLEMLGVFVDVQLDSVPRHTMVRRLRDIFPEAEALLRGAAAATSAHLTQCTHHVHNADEAVRRARQTAFGANCNLHYLSALLMFEYMVYHASSGAAKGAGSLARAVAADTGKRDDGTAAATAAASGGTLEVATASEDGATLEELKARYRAFLDTPISDGAAHTPMSVAQRIFQCPLSGPATVAATATLLSKRETVEITTTLPFALSLVIEPGPVNEFFTEQCMTIMVGDAADPPAGESDEATRQ